MIGGIVAGAVFMIFEMGMAAWGRGIVASLTPLRMIGAIVLGAGSLEPRYSLGVSAVAGAIVHMALSSVFGAIAGLGFSWLAVLAPVVLRSDRVIIGLTSVYGLALWLINLYVIAPSAGWPWFPGRSNPLLQFVGHTLFFGFVLGMYLANRIAVRRERIAITRYEPYEALRGPGQAGRR